MKKQWCFKHSDGWCASAKGNGSYSDHVRTVCRMVITLPTGIKFRIPDCEDCKRIIKKRNKRK